MHRLYSWDQTLYCHIQGLISTVCSSSCSWCSQRFGCSWFSSDSPGSTRGWNGEGERSNKTFVLIRHDVTLVWMKGLNLCQAAVEQTEPNIYARRQSLSRNQFSQIIGWLFCNILTIYGWPAPGETANVTNNNEMMLLRCPWGGSHFPFCASMSHRVFLPGDLFPMQGPLNGWDTWHLPQKDLRMTSCL